MTTRTFPIIVQVDDARIDTRLRALSNEKPVVVALRLRDRGWDPYKVSFDPKTGEWIAQAFERRQAS